MIDQQLLVFWSVTVIGKHPDRHMQQARPSSCRHTNTHTHTHAQHKCVYPYKDEYICTNSQFTNMPLHACAHSPYRTHCSTVAASLCVGKRSRVASRDSA
jgi:hypothetical protein